MTDRLAEIRERWAKATPGQAEDADVLYLLEVADAAQAVVESRPPVTGYLGDFCWYCRAEMPGEHEPDCPWLRLRGLVNLGADPGADRGHQVQITAPPRNT